ncbi:MAG TPA: SUMF1/EgtB/PvdO family nonheme iron enzyme, partial [Anaerolineales bacterium]|nr:SUMF1/EgtB/PvdO family nonheme iron enzyme [Anaerolineales bacterium]
LPTEAEWEKAASWDPAINQKRVYPWGNDFDCKKGNFDDETQLDSFIMPGGPNCDGYPKTSPVGSFPSGASPYGVLDMAGNAWEWVADGYQSDFYSHSPEENPISDSPVNRRVLRGGNWDSNADGIRVTNRFWAFPGRNDTDGFRCAKSD